MRRGEESGGKKNERSAKNQVYGQFNQHDRRGYNKGGSTADDGRQRAVESCDRQRGTAQR